MDETKISWLQQAREEVYEQMIAEEETKAKKIQEEAEMLKALLPEKLGDAGTQIVTEGTLTKDGLIEHSGYVFRSYYNGNYHRQLKVGKIIDQPDRRYLWREYSGDFWDLRSLGGEIDRLDKDWAFEQKERQEQAANPKPNLSSEQWSDIHALRYLLAGLESGRRLEVPEQFVLAALRLTDWMKEQLPE